MDCNTSMESVFFKRKIYLSYNISLLGKVGIDFVEKHNCFFLKQFVKNARYSEYHFDDHIGYEAWVNSFHLDYYITRYYEQAAFTYIINAICYWKMKLRKEIIGSLISSFSLGLKDVQIRLYTKRDEEEYYLVSDLNTYKFASILVVSSDDVIDNYPGSPRKWLPPWELLTDNTKEMILRKAARFR